MKLALLAMLACACSINHRSGDFSCTKTSDCSTGRTCDNGFCIVPGSIDAPQNDATKGGGDGNNCPPGCTSCNVATKQCTIDCSLPGSNCGSQITCPANYKCDVQCKGDNACRSGVNCAFATLCTVECIGTSSCRNVMCGAGRCDIMCEGSGSCQSNISCGNSCGCDITCTGPNSCQNLPSCTSAACILLNPRGCTSQPANCHSC